MSDAISPERAAVAARRVACILIGSLCMMTAPHAAHAQDGWNDTRTRALVELATQLRARQLADTGLTDYRADAHGYLTFLAQVGQGFTEPPRIVKADELALEVYWRAPNLSKQRIIGRRDTLLLPTDIAYHRDHLGIVQNNFPSIIRLGDGDEVRDVPHPLSAAGMRDYDYAIGDSLRIRLPGRDVRVLEVKVRPKDDRQPRVVGAVYIDPSDGQVVRMAFNFTRAAFIDRQLEDLSIVLENGLVGTRFWLPRRQEIEIRRTGTWLDYPVRGIIRGRWEISNYQINSGLSPSIFVVGPEIVQAPPDVQRRYTWPTKRVLDSLPSDVRAVTDADVRRVQAEARALVRAKALQRSRTLALSARSASDFLVFNRVEGLAPGFGLTQRLGGGVSLSARGRYGIDDEVVRGDVGLEYQTEHGFGLRLFARDDFQELGVVPERSRAVNSVAAQEFASDFTDPTGYESAGLAASYTRASGVRWTLEGAAARASTLSIHATPVFGNFVPPISVDSADHLRASLFFERPTSLWAFGTELRASIELRASFWNLGECAAPPSASCSTSPTTIRASLFADVQRPFGTSRLVLQTIAVTAAANGRGENALIPAQDFAYFGGPVTAPGYDFHELAGRAGASQRLEWRFPIPFFALQVGRFGKVPASATLAPYANVVGLTALGSPLFRGAEPVPRRVSGAYPSVGLGLLTIFDLLRFDVARGLRDGRWSFYFDVGRDFWSVL